MRIAFASSLLLAVTLASGACNSSPTEPASASSPNSASLAIEATSLPIFGATGTLTVENSTCPCSSSPLSISINDQTVGSIPCGTSRAFATATTTPPITIRAYTLGGQSTSLTFNSGGGASGAPTLSVRFHCN